MPSVDSNVLVRLLARDDARQFAAVLALLDAVEAANDVLFVPLTVVLELEWVLRSRYGCDKPGVLDALSALLETREVAFQDEDVLEEALALYRASRADFAECLRVGIALRHGRLPFHTFDRSAATLPGTALVRP